MKRLLLAALAGLATAFFGLVAILHTQFGRPVLRRLGVACPAMKVSPAQVESVRLRGVASLRSVAPSPARPALGQKLDVTRAADVRAWAGEHGFACTESIRPAHVLKCGAAGVAVLDPKAPPTDQIAFAFAPDGRLIGVDRLRSTLTPPEASRLFGEAAEALGAALGPAELAGEATPAYLAGGVMHTARLAYRFSDYLATVTAMNVGRRVVLHEQYESARGG